MLAKIKNNQKENTLDYKYIYIHIYVFVFQKIENKF